MYTNTGVITTGALSEEIIEKLQIYRFVGYQRLMLNFEFSECTDYTSRLRFFQNNTNLELFGKIVFHPRSISNLKKNLQKIKEFKKFAVAIESSDKKILTFAANDSRVDILTFYSIDVLRNLTPGIVSLLKQTKTFLEISLIDAICTHKTKRSRVFREIYKILNLVNYREDILLFGGAEKEIRYIRGPREILSIFHAIFNIPLQKCKNILNKNPEILVQRLEQRQNPNFIESGVKIINRFNNKY
ncbi:MAG: RNase P subunit p30 family protein [Promethearchaeota archaeon]